MRFLSRVLADVVKVNFLQNVAPEKRLERSVIVHLKKEGKTPAGILKMIEENRAKGDTFFDDLAEEWGAKSMKELASLIHER